MISRYRLPEAEQVPLMLEEVLKLKHVSRVHVDMEKNWCVVTQDIKPTKADEEFALSTHDVVRASLIEDLPAIDAPLFDKLQTACLFVREKGYVPTVLLCGDFDRFWNVLGVPQASTLLGIRIEECGVYSEDVCVLAGAISADDHISSISYSVTFAY